MIGPGYSEMEPAQRRRYTQILIAAMLAAGTAGSILVWALRDPSQILPWIVLVGILVLFAVGFVYAFRDFYRRWPRR